MAAYEEQMSAVQARIKKLKLQRQEIDNKIEKEERRKPQIENEALAAKVAKPEEDLRISRLLSLPIKD